MKTIQETVKEAVVQSLDEIRNKSVSQIKEKDITGGQNVEDKNIREKAIAEAFGNFVRTGEIRNKAVEMSESVQANGGYTVPQNIFDMILEKAKTYGVMRDEAFISSISVGNSMEFILEDGDFASSWVGEDGGRTDSNTGTFKAITCKAFEQWAMPVISRWLLQDSMFNLEDYIARKVGEVFGKAEETAFWKGTGDSANQPKGLLNGVTEGDIKTLDYKGLTEAIYTLDQEYANNAKFFMNRQTMGTLKNLVDGNNRPLFVATEDISNKYDGYILGYPVRFTEGLEKDEIVFGDMAQAYGILDKPADTGMLRDELTVPGKVKLPTYRRVGGTPLRREAFKYIKAGV